MPKRPRPAADSPALSPEPVPGGALVPQPHGGALRRGSQPGNKGGTGRTPSAIRELMRDALAERIPKVTALLDDATTRPDDVLRGMDFLAKYGLGTTRELSIEHVRTRLTEQLALIRRRLPADEAEALIAELRAIWR